MSFYAASDPFSGLIGLVIFVAIAAISHFLKRKQAGQDDPIPNTDDDEIATPARRGPSAPQPAGRQLSWEEEIKRLLEGQAPVEAPAPPPIVVVRRESPAPPPLPASPAPVWAKSGPTEEAQPHEWHDTTTGHMAVLREAASAHDRASHLGDTFRERLESVDLLAPTAPAKRSPVRQVQRTEDAEAVVTLLRQPRTARQVFIATAVLGPPRALAEM